MSLQASWLGARQYTYSPNMRCWAKHVLGSAIWPFLKSTTDISQNYSLNIFAGSCMVMVPITNWVRTIQHAY
jgi:hypothetical protein